MDFILLVFDGNEIFLNGLYKLLAQVGSIFLYGGHWGCVEILYTTPRIIVVVTDKLRQ